MNGYISERIDSVNGYLAMELGLYQKMSGVHGRL